MCNRSQVGRRPGARLAERMQSLVFQGDASVTAHTMVKANDPIWAQVAEILEDPSGRALLFNAFPTLVWCCDAEGRCNFVNQAWEDYTGRNLELEAGARWLQSVHADDRGALERGWREAI